MEIHEKIELRKLILLALYKSWEAWEDWYNISNINDIFPDINEIDLDRQIHYLEDKYYLKIVWKHIGKQYLSFLGIRITDHGVDLVENKEDFNKLFKIEVNTISEITNSSIVIGHHNTVTNEVNQIDKIIELLRKSDNPKKEEIIRVAEEYKISSSMELLWKLTGMTADAGTVWVILNTLFQSLS